MLGQIKSPTPPRVGLQYHPGCMDGVSLVRTKALTPELSDTMLLLLSMFMSLIFAHTLSVTPAKAAFWVPMPAT